MYSSADASALISFIDFWHLRALNRSTVVRCDLELISFSSAIWEVRSSFLLSYSSSLRSKLYVEEHLPLRLVAARRMVVAFFANSSSVVLRWVLCLLCLLDSVMSSSVSCSLNSSVSVLASSLAVLLVWVRKLFLDPSFGYFCYS